MDDADEELTQLAIRHALETELRYSEHVPARDRERAAQICSLSSAVARRSGWQIHTAQHPVDGGGTVVVVTRQGPLP